MELNEFVNAVRVSKQKLQEADDILYGIFGIPRDDPERNYRIMKAEELVNQARAQLSLS